MSSFSVSSDEKYKVGVQCFFQSLAKKDFETLLKVCTRDISLYWGPYAFVGNKEVKKWAMGLLDLFPVLEFKEKSFKVEGNVVRNEFIIVLITATGHKGSLACTSLYEFDNDLIKMIRMEISNGILLFKEEEVTGDMRDALRLQ